ncbi:hypothetical protein KEM52_005194, partial [Ascosphaera acerosa]
VSNRAFFPVYVHLYVAQFILLPLLARTKEVTITTTSPGADTPTTATATRPTTLALFLSNTLYLSAFVYYLFITFLGYNGLIIFKFLISLD